MRQLSVEIDELEEKALNSEILDLNIWVQEIVHAKAEHCMRELSDRRIKEMLADPKVTQIPADYRQIVNDMIVPTAVERNIRPEGDL